jgi:RNA polymerase sigma-70 factor, ECF subfamily
VSLITRLFSTAPRSKDIYIELLRPHVEILYRMAYRWTQNREDAEDLVQEILARLVDRVAEMQQVQQLRPWLIKVLYRRYVDLYRRQQRSPIDSEHEWTGDTTLLDQQLREAPDDRDLIHQLELQQVLLQGLQALDADQRDVVLLCDAEGYSILEVAEILEINVGTVKSRLHRARARLKNLLDAGTF